MIALALATVAMPAAAANDRKPPYWASIAAGKARMRTGPGRNFPAIWLYQRVGLPVRVVETYPNWRKISDPDGASGWVQANLLGEARTALVMGAVSKLRETLEGGKVVWRVEPGVVGVLSSCGGDRCLIDVKGRKGYIERSALWGLDPNEQLP